MNNRIAKRIATFMLTSVMTLTLAGAVMPREVHAERSVNDIQKDKDNLQNNIDSTNSQLVTLLAEVADLNSQISDKESEIADTQANLEAAEQSVNEQREAIKLRMKYTYESGQNATMLTAILESKNISDMLNRVEYANTIYQYDQNMLTAYQGTVEDMTEIKTQLQTEQTSLKTQKSELDAKKTSLNNTLATMKTQMGSIDTELAAAKEAAAKKAAEEKKKREEAQRKAAEEAARKATSSQQNSSDGTFHGSDGNGSSGSHNVAGGNPTASVNGSAIVSYAMQFVGNPYVWGGTSLTGGADCSGFVTSVYQHFGYFNGGRLTSGGFRSVGSAVSYDNIQPGDIVCYSGHVAIYAGGGKIVEAQSTKAGITANRSVLCHDILAIRRM